MSKEINIINKSNNIEQKKSSDSSMSSESGSDSESDSHSKPNSATINKKKNIIEEINNNEINKDNINISNNIENDEDNENINDYEILYDYKGNTDFSFKAIIIGDAFVGKSSIINKAVKQTFEPNYNPTLGFDYFLFYIRIKNKILKLQIWDTCGQEIYQSLITNFYRNSSVAFMVYAINNKESFEHLDNWLKEVKYTNNPDTKIFLIGNKSDLNNERKITYEEGKKYAENFEFSYFLETSAKTGEKVDDIMIKAAQILYKEYIEYENVKTHKKNLKENDDNDSNNRDFEINSENTQKRKKKKGCC